MRAKKVDVNQSTLVKQLRSIPGLTVTHTHTLGQGMADIIVGYQGRNYLLEIKDPNKPPSARKLTPDEERFHREWKGQIAVVETLEDVLTLLNLAA